MAVEGFGAIKRRMIVIDLKDQQESDSVDLIFIFILLFYGI